MSFLGLTDKLRQLRRIAEDYKIQMEKSQDVLEANILGLPEEVVEVIVDLERAEAYGLRLSEVGAAISSVNTLIPAGSLASGSASFPVSVPSVIETPEQLNNTVIRTTPDGGVLTLGDIASVRPTFKDPSTFSRVNGARAVSIEVLKRPGANDLEVSGRAKRLLEEFAPLLPAGVETAIGFDQSDFSNTMVTELQGNIMTAVALVMTVVVAALGATSALLVGLAVPVCFLFAFIVLLAGDFSFNFMVMFGLMLSMGMLIDGAMVVVEYADREMARGVAPSRAYARAGARMFWPVTAATLTTITAFMPLMFWPGVSGKFMRYLPITVFSVLSISLIYALVITPVLGATLRRQTMRIKVVLARLMNRKIKPRTVAADDADYVPTGIIMRTYDKAVTRAVQHPIVSLVFTIAILVSIFKIYGDHNAGTVFFPAVDPQFGRVEIEARGNLSPSEINEIARNVERKLLSLNMFQSVTITTGVGQGDIVAQGFMETLDKKALFPLTGQDAFDRAKAIVSDEPGIRVFIREEQGGPPFRPLEMEILAPDESTAVATTRKIRTYLDQELGGLEAVVDSIPRPKIEWRVDVDHSAAGLSGTSISEIGGLVQLGTTGLKVTEVRPPDAEESLDVRVRLADGRRTLSQFDRVMVTTNEGQVPLGSVSDIGPRHEAPVFARIDGLSAHTISGQPAKGFLITERVGRIREWIAAPGNVPPNVQVRFAGSDEQEQEAQAFLGNAALLALFIMLILLVTQFNNFYQAALILSAVIVSSVGVLFYLVVFQQRFAIIMTGTALVTLAGIVVNNNIVLISAYNTLREDNPDMSVPRAAIIAASLRFRPVMLTTGTTVLGLLPLASGVSVDLINRTIAVGNDVAVYWELLAACIVWGLALSTLTTLLVTPAMLALPEALRERIKRWRGSPQPEPAEAT